MELAELFFKALLNDNDIEVKEIEEWLITTDAHTARAIYRLKS